MRKVLHFVSRMDRAGQETFLMNMYRGINRDNVQFGFLCSKDGKGDYDEEILLLGGNIYHCELNQKSGKLRHLDNFNRLVAEFKKYKDDYDIVHIHNYHAFDMTISAAAALKAGIKNVIVHSHNACADSHLGLHHIFRPILSALPVTRLACSNDAGKWMYTKDFTVIRNGIDVNKFSYDKKLRQSKRNELGISDKFVVGHVGRFEPQKNHEFLIKVFSEFLKVNPDTVLLLIGQGSRREAIQALVTQLDIAENVIFMGVREDTAEIYQAMDVFLFPSLFEGLGIVAVEAQTSGLPCIISENLPHDLDITTNIYRCNLNDSIQKWTSCLQLVRKNIEKEERTSCSDEVCKSGYDSLDSISKLETIYLNLR